MEDGFRGADTELCIAVTLQSQPGLPGGSVLRVPILLQSDE